MQEECILLEELRRLIFLNTDGWFLPLNHLQFIILCCSTVTENSKQ